MAGGIASAAFGVTFLVLSNRSADAASEPGTRAQFLDHLDDATVRRRVGIVGLGLGAALLTAGIIRYASMHVTSDGTSVLVSGRF